MANPTRNRRASARYTALGNHSDGDGRDVKILCAVAMYPSEAPVYVSGDIDAINSQKLPDGVEMEIAYYYGRHSRWRTGHHDETQHSTAESNRRRLCCNVDVEADMICSV